MSDLRRGLVADIPVVWCEPASGSRELVIWLPGFSGTKENVEPQLRDVAQAGFIALSYDPFQHGERRIETNEALVTRIIGNIRRHFWPILAHTAQDANTVIDWAQSELGVESKVRMGGVSMGGDIAVAAAGMDHRIATIAACVATPDWLRPGSHEPPGEPDEAAQRCYDECNPLTHLERYAHGPAIRFECGAQDTQVPPDGAQRFAAALSSAYAVFPERLQVHLHEGVAHTFTEAMWQNALDWFRRF